MMSQLLLKIKKNGLINSLKIFHKKIFVRTLSKFIMRIKLFMILKSNENEEVFTKIYESNYWGNAESRSGIGSTLLRTEITRSEIRFIINKFSIEKVVDAPCGDFNWFSELIQDIDIDIDIDYTGYDIVESLIIQNTQYYGGKGIKFLHGDITSGNLEDCDLLIVRDALFHFSFNDIRKFFKNLERVDFKYLLTTTFETDVNFENIDIRTGDFREIDLFKEPFCLNKESVIHGFLDTPDQHDTKKMILLSKKSVSNIFYSKKFE